MFSFFIKN